MQQLSYQDQLADSRWLQKKAEILIRDNYTCQVCGAKSYLNVHHKNYQKGKLAWEYPNKELVTLCRDCHSNKHDVVPILAIGKFYNFEHSDYWNDMLCYHIDNRNKLVYLFGIDCGCFGSGYIYVLTFDEFYSRCYNSTIFKDDEPELYDYNTKSFYLAYCDLLKGNAEVINSRFYTNEQIISFAKNKVRDLLNSNEVITKLFKQFGEGI